MQDYNEEDRFAVIIVYGTIDNGMIVKGKEVLIGIWWGHCLVLLNGVYSVPLK